MQKYIQCKLSKNNLVRVAFIPKEFAIIGKSLKIKNGEVWENGWVVVRTSTIIVDEAHLPDSHSEIKSHRKKTGDASPKVVKDLKK